MENVIVLIVAGFIILVALFILGIVLVCRVLTFWYHNRYRSIAERVAMAIEGIAQAILTTDSQVFTQVNFWAEYPDNSSEGDPWTLECSLYGDVLPSVLYDMVGRIFDGSLMEECNLTLKYKVPTECKVRVNGALIDSTISHWDISGDISFEVLCKIIDKCIKGLATEGIGIDGEDTLRQNCY